MDGVITDTGHLHAACWKQMFDEYLQTRATQRGEAFRPFELAHGLPPLCGREAPDTTACDFLTSAGIQLPEGRPDDPPRAETVGGLGNRKNELVNETIEARGGAV